MRKKKLLRWKTYLLLLILGIAITSIFISQQNNEDTSEISIDLKYSEEEIIRDISNFCSRIEVILSIDPEEPMYTFNDQEDLVRILNIMKMDEWQEGIIDEEISAVEYLFLYTNEYKYLVEILEYDSGKTGFHITKKKGDIICDIKTYLSQTIRYNRFIRKLKKMCK